MTNEELTEQIVSMLKGVDLTHEQMTEIVKMARSRQTAGDWVENAYKTPEYQLGESMESYRMSTEAQVAYDKGEIELWLEYHRGKTIEKWEEFEKTYGTHEDMRKRWTRS
jgi:hypothetical protein